MTIETFLSFWNKHNILIIDVLIGVIVVLSLMQAYRLFFGKKSVDSDGSSSLDAAQIEKTLQKILEAQNHGKSASRGASSEDMGIDVDVNDMDESLASEGAAAKPAISVASSNEGVSEETAAEITQLKQSLAERQKQIETLQAEVKKAVESAPSPAAAEGGGAGMSAEEKGVFDEKIRDLEARLAEYEIISEDIADLSKYKEENESLKAQLESLRSSGGAAPATPVEDVSPEALTAAAEVEPSAEPAAEPAAEPDPTPEAGDQAAAEADIAALVNEIKPPPSEEPSSELIDDELMKEFAMAVEGQKALEQAADKAGPGDQAAKKTDETEKLLGEFENFVNKKS